MPKSSLNNSGSLLNFDIAEDDFTSGYAYGGDIGSDFDSDGDSINGGLTKAGDGTLVLTGDNTYKGVTTIYAGTLKGNIAADTDLTVAAGATYDGTGAAREVNVLSGAGSIVNTHGLTTRSGEFSGVISGAGGLTQTGGDLTLSGDNTYEGGTTINASNLTIGSGSALGTGKLTVSGDIQQSSIKFTGAHTLDNNIEMINAAGTGSFIIDSGGYDVTIAGDISDSGGNNGALTKEGTGTLTLTGANDYEGRTTIRRGTLFAGAPNALDEGVYAINGGKLDLNGHNLTMLGLEGSGGEILLGGADLTVDLNGAAPSSPPRLFPARVPLPKTATARSS